MNIKQTIRNLVLGGLLLIPVVAVAFAPVATVSAADKTCGGVSTAIIECGGTSGGSEVEDTGLWKLLIIVINFMTAGVGILALVGLVYGAVLYTSAGGNPEQVKKARTIFLNVVIGVVAFGAMYTLLNFIIPGGIFA